MLQHLQFAVAFPFRKERLLIRIPKSLNLGVCSLLAGAKFLWVNMVGRWMHCAFSTVDMARACLLKIDGPLRKREFKAKTQFLRFWCVFSFVQRPNRGLPSPRARERRCWASAWRPRRRRSSGTGARRGGRGRKARRLMTPCPSIAADYLNAISIELALGPST